MTLARELILTTEEVERKPGALEDGLGGVGGFGELGGVGAGGGVDGLLGVHFLLDEARVDGEDAREAPVDGGELLHEAEFDGAGRAEAPDVVVEVFLVSVGVLG